MITAKAGLVDFDYVKATGHSTKLSIPKTAGSNKELELEWTIPKRSNAIERDRTRAYHQVYSTLVALSLVQKVLAIVRKGDTKTWSPFKVPEEAVSVGFHEAARGVLTHHMVIRDGKIANYQMFPPTPWNGVRAIRTARPVHTRTPARTRRSSRRTGRTILRE
jgi:hydrogenase large subunit